jgi:hypothetical protein
MHKMSNRNQDRARARLCLLNDVCAPHVIEVISAQTELKSNCMQKAMADDVRARQTVTSQIFQLKQKRFWRHVAFCDDRLSLKMLRQMAAKIAQ